MNSPAICNKKIKRNSIKKARDSYQYHSEEGKKQKRWYGCERYRNLTENEKQILVQYREISHKMLKRISG